MKAVYVSLLTVITQRGITNREKGARGEGGGREGGAVSAFTAEWSS